MFIFSARKNLVLLIVTLTIPVKCLSQETIALSSEQVSEFFDQIYGVDQRLVSGSFYYGPQRGSIMGNAFFIDETWKKGSVSLDDITYENLDLKYDIIKNLVVLKFKSLNHSELQISLKNEEIDTFRMDNRIFVPLPVDSINNSNRFCELIVSGEINYFIQKRKVLQLSNGGAYDFEYQEYIQQYIQIDDQLVPFKGWHMIYRLLPEIKQDLRKFIRSEGLIPGKNRIDERKIMIEHCNKLLSGLR